MIQKIKLLIKRIRFNIQYAQIMLAIKSSKESTLVTYPLLVQLHFNKDKMFDKYIKTGKSAKAQTLRFIEIGEKHFERNIKAIGEEPSEAQIRLEKIRYIRQQNYYLKYELADLEKEFGKSVDDLVNEAMNNNN